MFGLCVSDDNGRVLFLLFFFFNYVIHSRLSRGVGRFNCRRIDKQIGYLPTVKDSLPIYHNVNDDNQLSS